MPQPRMGVKGKMAAGGVVAAAIGLAIYGLINGFGGGSGVGITDGSGIPSVAGDGKSDDENPPNPDSPADDSETTAGPLRVVVEPGGFSIANVDANGARTYEKADLDVIAKRAAKAEAEDGYRVHITLRRGVSIDAHNRLVKRLEQEGLEPDEILGYDNKKAALETSAGA